MSYKLPPIEVFSAEYVAPPIRQEVLDMMNEYYQKYVRHMRPVAIWSLVKPSSSDASYMHTVKTKRVGEP